MKAKPQIKNLEQMIHEYKTLKNQVKTLEEKIKDVGDILREHATSSPDNKFIAGPFSVSLSTFSTEKFDLKSARPVLKSALDAFIKTITVTRLDVR